MAVKVYLLKKGYSFFPLWNHLLAHSCLLTPSIIGDINYNKGENKNTALIVAAANGHADIVDLLIANNCKLNIKNEYGRTALTSACYLGNYIDLFHNYSCILT